jgi:hypothetical protein
MLSSVSGFVERWTEATKEARSLYMRGEEVSMIIPVDFVERVLDYILHVLKTLKQLYEDPGTSPSPPLVSWSSFLF